MIKENVQRLFAQLPANVQLVAAAKGRTVEEIRQAIAAGVKIVGENYVQEAQAAFRAIGRRVEWHFIGQLQKNKVKKAVKIFDMIETVDAVALGAEIEKASARENKIMPVLLEINSAEEKQKFGFLAEETVGAIKELMKFKHLKIMGLMTMGAFSGDPESSRPYFARTRKLFNRIKELSLDGVEMQYLSMGMTNSYRIAVEEGANIVRIGSKIFGPRPLPG